MRFHLADMTGFPIDVLATLVDRYGIEHELARGGMATVYLGAEEAADDSLPEITSLRGFASNSRLSSAPPAFAATFLTAPYNPMTDF